jgi:hypothetical protein
MEVIRADEASGATTANGQIRMGLKKLLEVPRGPWRGRVDPGAPDAFCVSAPVPIEIVLVIDVN